MALRFLLFVFFFFSVHTYAKTQTQAIQTIAIYTQSNAVVPTVSDYDDAGVINVGTHNIDGINEKISKHQSNEVDTTAEIQAVVDDYILMIHAVLNIITNHILNSDATIRPNMPTLTALPSSVTIENNITIEVNGEASNSVYINGVVVGVLDENGKLIISIPLIHGMNTLHITLKDENANESEALLLEIVSNHLPVANDDTVSMDENTELQLGLLDIVNNNDMDIDGDTLNIVSVTNSTNGTVSLNNNTITFVPIENFNGIASFEYTISDGYGGTDTATVSITVNKLNHAPIANDDTTNTNEDTTIILGVVDIVTNNDTDIDGDTLSIIAVSNPMNGTVSLNADIITFVPSSNFNGTASFEYTISDGYGGTDTAIVSVTVNAVNDAPIAVDDSAEINGTMNFIATAADIVTPNDIDVDNDTLTIIGVSNVVNGSVSLNNGTITFIPEHNFEGIASFKYTISDGNGGTSTAMVRITVTLDILINEISSAYYINDDRWFEIYNPKTTAVNLSDYTLKSRYYDGSTSGDFEFSFPSKVISAGGYMVVRSNYGPAYNISLPAVENSEVMYLKDSSSHKYPLWYSDIGGYLELLKDGETIDFVTIETSYTPTTAAAWGGSPVPAFTSDAQERYKSIVRDINSMDTNSANDWTVRDFATYAAINDVTSNDDSDADGIPDCSEVSGSTYAGMDLYAMGARTNQKDIFVEVDYIDSTDGGNRAEDKGVVPQIEALEKVRDVFLNKGYHIHFDVGDLFVQSGLPINPYQMDLGGGNMLPYVSSLNLDDVRAYKPAYMQTQRKAIFHYMVFGTSQNSDGSGGGSSGLAELLGNDILITLGVNNLSDDTATDKNMLVNFQAATVMHEFGHNLGLGHGGDEGVNYKPNYLSIMNYLYQLYGLPTIGTNEGDRYYHKLGGNCSTTAMTNPFYADYINFKIDYSDGTGTNIDEVNGVVEGNGLGRLNSVPVDYNCNDIENDILTNFNVNPGWSTEKTVLKDYDDWANINIVFAHTYSGNSGATLNQTTNKVSINPLSDDRQPIAEEPAIKIPSLR